MKIVLDRPSVNDSLDYLLKYLKYDHNKRHILFAYQLLNSLGLNRDIAAADFGCGGAETLMLLDKLGFENVTAADYDEETLTKIRKIFKGRVEGVKVDFNEKLPMETRSLDLITAFEVVEHVVKAEFFLAEVNRVLKEGGYLIITTPNHSFYKSRTKALRGDRLGKEGVHYRFFTKEHFEEVLTGAGFVIEKRRSLGHLPLVDREPIRSVLRRKRVHHYVPESLESLFAINFVWLCRKGA